MVVPGGQQGCVKTHGINRIHWGEFSGVWGGG